MRMRAIGVVLACALVLGGAVAPAQAFRPLISDEVLETKPLPTPSPPPDGQVEGACGIAVAGSDLYVSEYYRHRVDVFSSGRYSSQLAAPNPLDGVCGLSLTGGALYANEWHEGVVRLLPSVKAFDSGHESTGVAADSVGNVYALNRTYVAVYQPTGAPVLDEGQPLEIGAGSLGDAYGIAVAGGRVYVADAASNSVKVFEPAGDPAVPVMTISAGFTSLVDSALAVDPATGHLLVLDNLQPGYVHPEAAVDEFATDGTLLDQITTPGGIVHGGPSGLVFNGPTLYVTTGNDEGSNVLKFGPYVEGFSAPAQGALSPAQSASPPSAAAAATVADAGGKAPTAADRRRGATASEVTQQGDVRVALQAKLTPKKLPRSGRASVHFSIGAKIGAANGEVPPQLSTLEVAINNHGRINPGSLPACEMDQVQPASTKGALEACGRSLVGEGTFSAKVLLTQQSPFPSDGEVVAFNGRWQGKPAILAHIYGTQPVPTSFTLPFVIAKAGGKGPFGTALKASLPQFTSKWGYVTGISLFLGRSTPHGGYLTAGCPAPKGFGGASFPLARARLSFTEGRPSSVEQTLTRSCGVR